MALKVALSQSHREWLRKAHSSLCPSTEILRRPPEGSINECRSRITDRRSAAERRGRTSNNEDASPPGPLQRGFAADFGRRKKIATSSAFFPGKRERIEWCEKPRLAIGKRNLVSATPGLGKIITIDLQRGPAVNIWERQLATRCGSVGESAVLMVRRRHTPRPTLDLFQ